MATTRDTGKGDMDMGDGKGFGASAQPGVSSRAERKRWNNSCGQGKSRGQG